MELAKQAYRDDSQWNGVEEAIEDPEEIRVIFCALDSFSQYAKTAHLNCTHLRRQAFYALPQAHWQLLAQPPFSYLDTLNRIDDAIESNAELARIIVKVGLKSFGVLEAVSEKELTMPEEWSGVAKYNDLDKARSTIRQFYRDWSAEGAIERDACYGPIYRALNDERARHPNRQPMKVLVPGAGLGRLVFDLCRTGYHTEGNEISYHQLLASSYILNSTETAGQHTIFPWIHSFSNHKSRDNQFKSYKIPDIHPQTTLAGTREIGSMEMCAADFLCLYGDESHKDTYDAVASVFFLDTAPNLIRYLEVIRNCLKPGGVLINVGPLLWHWENHVPGHHGYDGDGDYDENNTSGIADPGSFELTDDEVVALVERMGFILEKRETDLHAPYVQDSQSMLQTVYKASHWVARKPEDESNLMSEI
ncbi:N2227-domain-containing protein [Daldinia decipiens]|uniref:N2227-domain-containing protein n=1 Tax=Daldinia decipiens TaxID=326647 RepID=UPI0020C51EB6|nr:N2227-domain-containing protein [Daldinia decipiens]KAI1659941.1 N2227-domain-containing protein [Daldinia decipiens]